MEEGFQLQMQSLIQLLNGEILHKVGYFSLSNKTDISCSGFNSWHSLEAETHCEILGQDCILISLHTSVMNGSKVMHRFSMQFHASCHNVIM